MATVPPALGGRAPTVGGSGPSRWLTWSALLVALVACILAVIGWFRPVSAPTAEPTVVSYSDDEVAAAKSKACEAFGLVSGTVTRLSHLDGGDDAALRQALATNGRLALVAGQSYLTDQTDAAAPEPLVQELQTYARLLLKMSMNYLAGQHNESPEQARVISDTEASSGRLVELCNKSR